MFSRDKNNWRDDLQASGRWFVDLVWPEISGMCGGGDVVPVELLSVRNDYKQVDMRAGVDAWQVSNQYGIRGIASRVQQSQRGFPTFTIRYARSTGAKTEYHKRKESLVMAAEGWLYPYWTVQGYVFKDSLVSAAVVKTKDMFDAIDDSLTDALIWHVRKRDPVEAWKQFKSRSFSVQSRPPIYLQENSHDSNLFIVVPWSVLKNSGKTIGIFERAKANA